MTPDTECEIADALATVMRTRAETSEELAAQVLELVRQTKQLRWFRGAISKACARVDDMATDRRRTVEPIAPPLLESGDERKFRVFTAIIDGLAQLDHDGRDAVIRAASIFYSRKP